MGNVYVYDENCDIDMKKISKLKIGTTYFVICDACGGGDFKCHCVYCNGDRVIEKTKTERSE